MLLFVLLFLSLGPFCQHRFTVCGHDGRHPILANDRISFDDQLVVLIPADRLP